MRREDESMSTETAEATKVLSILIEQRTYPPYDAYHSTPSAMLWRRATITTPSGQAVFEQTDYGHPGRLNDWDPRGIAPSLAPKLAQLKATLDAVTAFLA